MIMINGKPIIFHIMKHYSNYGFKNFYIAAGYKSNVIKNTSKKFVWMGYQNYRNRKKTMTGGRLKDLKII